MRTLTIHDAVRIGGDFWALQLDVLSPYGHRSCFSLSDRLRFVEERQAVYAMLKRGSRQTVVQRYANWEYR